MKLMITGSNGQLGNEIISCLKSGKSELGSIPALLENPELFPVDVNELDITNNIAVKAFISKNKPDIIINCAAMTNVDGCETAYENAFKVNALGVRNLAIAADETGAKLIHISTDYVFDGNGTKPYNEWDNPNPQSVYGASKALGEKYAMNFCRRCFIIRTSWLYGYVGKNFIKTVRRILKERGNMTVVNDQRGNPTNANDLAHHILKLAVTEEYGIYHCTGTGECTWFDLAQKTAELSGFSPESVKPCSSDEYPSPTKRPAYSSLRNLALECTVGNEMRDWQLALEKYISNLEDYL